MHALRKVETWIQQGTWTHVLILYRGTAETVVRFRSCLHLLININFIQFFNGNV